ncbi:ribonuclease [Bacillus sp. CGMCC 1.60114]|uniref:ribonuclease n=1 Tax=unclassified Bacillus (in: firmicutes) TaxID=185979 RepID=UPI003635004B
MTEYDAIWNQQWKPVWTEITANPKAINPATLKEKMNAISNKYDELSKKVVDFKAEDKISDSALKEKIANFRNEFVLATSYRGNAARAIVEGLDGAAPIKDRMEEAKKSVGLSDKHLTNAVGNLSSAESELGIKRK